MSSEYNQELCDQKHKETNDKFAVIDSKLDMILCVLNGNGKLGLVGKVEILWGVSIFLIASIVATGIKVWLL